MVAAADDDVFLPFVKKLTDTKGWEVSDYFLSYSSGGRQHSPREYFPNYGVHLQHEASRGKLPAGQSHHPLPELDSEILERMRPYEHMYMCMFDVYDPDGRSFSAIERRSAYYHMLRFGLYFMKHRRPD